MYFARVACMYQAATTNYLDSVLAGAPDDAEHQIALHSWGQMYKAIEYDNLDADYVMKKIEDLLGPAGVEDAKRGRLDTPRARLSLLQAGYFCNINKVNMCGSIRKDIVKTHI